SQPGPGSGRTSPRPQPVVAGSRNASRTGGIGAGVRKEAVRPNGDTSSNRSPPKQSVGRQGSLSAVAIFSSVPVRNYPSLSLRDTKRHEWTHPDRSSVQFGQFSVESIRGTLLW